MIKILCLYNLLNRIRRNIRMSDMSLEDKDHLYKLVDLATETLDDLKKELDSDQKQS